MSIEKFETRFNPLSHETLNVKVPARSSRKTGSKNQFYRPPFAALSQTLKPTRQYRERFASVQDSNLNLLELNFLQVSARVFHFHNSQQPIRKIFTKESNQRK